MNYAEYIAQFNSGDDAYLVQKYFTEDCIFSTGKHFLRGREALLKYFEAAHDGVREIIRPQLVLQDEKHIFAEIDMDFHATKGRADFPFGALLPGDTLTVKFFVVYRLREGQVAELRSASWPAGHGVSKHPPLGGDAGQRAAFHACTRAFSEGQLGRFIAFCTEDVILELPGQQPLRGKEAIVDYYSEMFQTVRENLTLHQFVADSNSIAADMTSRYTAIKDAPDFHVMPLAQGESVSMRMFVYYTLHDGLISHMQAARRGEPVKERATNNIYPEPPTTLSS
jgi:ketosteroid isomerase-like protein